MTQEEEHLLLKDLCARLPYGTLCDRLGKSHKLLSIVPDKRYCLELYNGEYASSFFTIDDVKPYLRPMSSMTEEEKNECNKLRLAGGMAVNVADYQDWLNAHHFDYRDLIEKGLALVAPEDMYKTHEINPQ